METLCWNRCFICSSPVEVTKTERSGESSSHLRLHVQNHSSSIKSNLLTHKMLFQYLLVDSQDVKDSRNNEKKSLVRDIIQLDNQRVENGASSSSSTTGVGLSLCSFCNQLGEQVKALQLQLEVVQMKLIDKLKTVKQCVLSNSRLYGSNDAVRLQFQKFEDQLEQKASSGEQCENERNFLDVLHRFQTFIFESDIQVRNIPLVYLNKYTGGYGETYPLISPTHGKGLKGGLQTVAEMDKVKNIKEELVMDDFQEEFEELPFLATYSNSDEDIKLKDEVLAEAEAAGRPSTRRKKKGGKKRKYSAITGSAQLSIQIKKAKFKTERKRDKKPKPKSEDTGPTRRSCRVAATTQFEEPKPKNKKSKSAIKQESLSEAQKLAIKMKDEIKKKRISENTGMSNRKKRGVVTCEECSYETNVVPRMEQHFMDHDGTDPEQRKYECPDCKKRFRRYQYFEFHVTHFCGSISWRCDICTAYFPRQEMKKHIEEVHGTSKLYPCDHCSFQFVNFATLVSHFVLHNRPELKYCLECDDSKRPKFRTRQHLLRHLHEVHGHNELVLKCDYENCSAIFYNGTMLARHRHIDHKRTYVCESCDRPFETQGLLDIHINVAHKKAKPFQCEQCPERFPSKLYLEKHMIREHNMVKYKCEQCPEKIFTESHSLNCHLKKVHGIGDMEFIQCQFCSKQFLHKGVLRRHELLHLDKRDFTCEVCGFATKTRRMLLNHMVSHVPDSEKKHACSYCPKTFALKKYLNNHLRIHTLERPYQCEICGATFNQKGPLIGHRKKIHNAVVDSPSLTIFAAPGPSQQKDRSGGDTDNALVDADNSSTVVSEVK
ncbi:unnamed protein product [Orchesella dallaii]|uniref:C2H2-type domain-containing protein n=1 Tax=Orchesella dallaii TaxID=48710 RepID=A0ABP1PWE2_9HEXA